MKNYPKRTELLKIRDQKITEARTTTDKTESQTQTVPFTKLCQKNALSQSGHLEKIQKVEED